MQEVVMATSNAGKYNIAKKIFEKKGIKLVQEKIETPEIQSYDVEEVSKYSALYAAKKIMKPVIKSDVGYFIEELHGFPGPFLKYINGMLTSNEILKMLENKDNRNIVLRECVTYAEPNGFYKQFVSEENAKIAYEEAGEGSTFDKIVIFEGENKPKALNTAEENYEHFVKSLKVYEYVSDYLENKK